MGLDAYAFERVTLAEPHEQTDGCWELDHTPAFITDNRFHRSLRGLIEGRCYETGGKRVHVGQSYGGHTRFRAQLARVFLAVEPVTVWENREDYVDRPFYEFIDFSDAEGTIGPKAAADLAADFASGRERFRDAVLDDWSRQKYDQWADAFATAASGGLVLFA